MQLVEEAAEGCWIGFRARTSPGASEIGSVYSPPSHLNSATKPSTSLVETVVDVGHREHVRIPSSVSPAT